MKPVLPENAAKFNTVADDPRSELDLDVSALPEDVLIAAPYNETDSEPLPNITIKAPFSVSESGAFDAIRLLLRKTGLALTVEGDQNAARTYGSVSVYDLSGSLQEIMDQLAKAMGFFYQRKGGTIFVQMEQQFVVAMPPIIGDDSMAGMVNTIKFLGAKDLYLDRNNRTVIFTSNRRTYNRIADYLQKTRQTRSIIVYDIHIYQVDLNDAGSKGIQWNKFGYNSMPGVAGNAVAGGGSILSGVTSSAAAALASHTATGLGVVLAGTRFSADLLVDFLETQGTVKTVSQPRIGVMNGSKARIRVGAGNTYVSKVGTNFSTALNQVTMETANLRTGTELSLVGTISDGSVYTTINMSVSELVRFDNNITLGLETKLPQTVDRELETTVRARPGDTFLLGGISIERDLRQTQSGISANTKREEVVRSELVIALTPRVLRFKPVAEKKTTFQIKPEA